MPECMFRYKIILWEGLCAAHPAKSGARIDRIVQHLTFYVQNLSLRSLIRIVANSATGKEG